MDERTFEPDSPDLAVKSAFSLYLAGDAVAAVQVARESMQDCADKNSLSLVLAMALRKLGKQRDAVPVLDAVLASAPERADLWTLQGMCYRDLARSEKASVSFRNAIKADPDYARAKYQLAVVTQEMGRDLEAVPLFNWYLKTEVGARNALAWSLLGVSYRRLKKFDFSVSAIE